MIARAADADVVVKASGVGIFDDLLLEVWQAARPGALKIFWDVDAPATLAELAAQPDHPLRRSLPDLDLVLTYGGGPPVVRSEEHTSELQSLMRISYAVFCLNKKKNQYT